MVKSVGRKVSGMGGRKGSAAVAGGGGKSLTGKMTDKKVKQLKNADDYESRPIWAKDISETEYKQIIGAPTRDTEGVLRQQKRGGKVMYREEGGPLKGDQKKLDTNNDGKITNKDLKTLRAKPKSKPTPPSDGGATGRGRRSEKMDIGEEESMGINRKTSIKKKMGGGKVMKYKKGGIVYMKGGGIIKANSGGQGIVDSAYTKV